MIEHIWSVLCLKSIVDSDTNLISLFEIIEELTIQSYTETGITPVEFEITTCWFRENAGKEKEYEYKISLITPLGKDKGGPDIQLQLKKGIQRIRSRTRFQAFPVEELGIYWFKVSLKGAKGKYREVASIPITIKEKKPT